MSDFDQDNTTTPRSTTTLSDDALDAMLARHVSSELSGQTGRSVGAFRGHVVRERTQPTAPPSRFRRGPWTLGLVGGALAASIAIIAAGPNLWRTAGPVDRPPVLRMDQTVSSELYDGGTFVSDDGTPMRRIRRVNQHQIRDVNESTGEEVEQIVPSEDLMLYQLRTY